MRSVPGGVATGSDHFPYVISISHFSLRRNETASMTNENFQMENGKYPDPVATAPGDSIIAVVLC